MLLLHRACGRLCMAATVTVMEAVNTDAVALLGTYSHDAMRAAEMRRRRSFRRGQVGDRRDQCGVKTSDDAAERNINHPFTLSSWLSRAATCRNRSRRASSMKTPTIQRPTVSDSDSAATSGIFPARRAETMSARLQRPNNEK